MLKMDKEGKCEVIRLPFLQDENDSCILELQKHLNKTAKQQASGNRRKHLLKRFCIHYKQ